MTLYVDTETTGLDPRKDELRVVAINGQAYDFWGLYDPNHPDIIREILDSRKDETFVAHNAQFDLDFLAEHVGFYPTGDVFDTMVGYQILQCGRREPTGGPISASLANVCYKLLGTELDKTWQKGPWNGILFGDQLEYAAKDTAVLPELHKILSEALRKSNLMDFMKLEMQVLPALLAARRRGVLLDVESAKQLLEDTDKEVEIVREKLPKTLNPRAPEQVAKFFKLKDSKEDTLRESKWKLKEQGNYEKQSRYNHLVNVMDARKKLKRASSVKKRLLSRVAYDGRIHTSFKQTATETGRLASSEPNLQNQDRGPEVRGLFVPMDGCRFVIADYAQLEVRIAALVSGDQNLQNVFLEGRDIHSETCAAIFGEETKTTRTLSKNILFGSLFGGGHSTVIRFAAKSDVKITPDEAKEYQAAFFANYPTLKKWHEKAGDTRPEYVYSLLGRRRFIEPGEAYCTRINNKIQATAADGMKIAMVRLYKVHDILPLLSVHDELILEAKEDVVEHYAHTLQEEMINSMYRATKQDKDNPIVPISVEVDIGTSWADKS